MSGIKTCFILEPRHGGEGAISKKDLDEIFNRIIEPAIDAHGYRIVRSSLLAQAEHVSRDHLILAKEATLLVANISGGDPVVFYCLAHRMARHELGDLAERQPVITMLDREEEERFYLPGPTAYPVRYSLAPDRGADDPQGSNLKERNLINARRDLNNAVLRRLAMGVAPDDAEETAAEEDESRPRGGASAGAKSARPAEEPETEPVSSTPNRPTRGLGVEDIIRRAMRDL